MVIEFWEIKKFVYFITRPNDMILKIRMNIEFPAIQARLDLIGRQKTDNFSL